MDTQKSRYSSPVDHRSLDDLWPQVTRWSVHKYIHTVTKVMCALYVRCALSVLQKECRKVWGARYTLGARYRSENTVFGHRMSLQPPNSSALAWSSIHQTSFTENQTAGLYFQNYTCPFALYAPYKCSTQSSQQHYPNLFPPMMKQFLLQCTVTSGNHSI